MKIKALFIMPSLMAGGAERVFSFIPQNLNPSLIDPVILIVGHPKDTVYDTGDVRVTYLKKNRVKHGIFEIVKFIIKEKPQVIFSSMIQLNVLLGLLSFFFPKTRFIIRATSVASIMSDFYSFKVSPLMHKTHKILYNKVDKIICQSSDMTKDFSERYNIPLSKIKTIGNPITNLEHKPDTEKKIMIHGNKYITVGRLSKEKGHERILNLLSELKTDFSYTIVGDGPEKDNIAQLVTTLGLERKVQYISHSSEVSELLKSHDLFLQGSYVEGFPNAVLESCTVGTPVLAFNVPGGTKDIIEHGINGFLIENEQEFLKHLNNAKKWDPIKVSESVVTKFGPQTIISDYENLIVSSKNV